MVDLAVALPVVILEDDGTVAQYTHGKDLLKVSRNGEYYYFHDHLGSTRTITDIGGSVVATYVYDPYGTKLDELCSDVAWNKHLFTGEFSDPVTKLIYLRARWYDPLTGRFVTRDTYTGTEKDPLTQHPYSYCAGDPIDRTDSTGNDYSLGGMLSTMATQGILFGLISGTIDYVRHRDVGHALEIGAASGIGAAIMGGAFYGAGWILGAAGVTAKAYAAVRAVIPEGKWLFLFGKIVKGEAHNIERSAQLLRNLMQLGFHESGKELVEQVIFDSLQYPVKRISRTFVPAINKFVESEVHEILVQGPSGVWSKWEVIWGILPDGTRFLRTVEIFMGHYDEETGSRDDGA